MAKRELKKAAKTIWWTVVLGGILSIIFGIVTLVWPELTLATLISIFGVFIIVFGAIGLVESVYDSSMNPIWWLSFLLSAASVGIGVFLLCNPAMTLTLFMVFLIIFIFGRALVDFVAASYARESSDRWLWVLSGILGVVFGFIIIFHPDGATLAFLWAIGLYAIIRGVLMEIYAIRIKGGVEKVKKILKSK